MKAAIFCTLALLSAAVSGDDTNLTISPDGNLVNDRGEIKYYLSQVGTHVPQSQLKRYGKLWRGKYPEQYRYLYEGTMNEEYFQKLGCNMMHFYSPYNIAAAAFPEYTPEKLDDYFTFYHQMLKKYDAGKMNRQWGLQAYQDHIDNMRTFTHTPIVLNMRSAGLLVLRIYPEITKRFLEPGSIAKNPRGSATSLACDLSSPAGRKLMRKLYTAELDWFKMTGVKPFALKIYNEPSYENYSSYARRDFAKLMKEKFGTVDAMNKAWGTKYQDFEKIGVRPGEKNFSIGAGVEFRKMNERAYADMTNEMARISKSKYPGIPTFIQMMGGSHNLSLDHGNNVYLLHDPREIIVSGTGNYTFSSLEDYEDNTPAKDALSVGKDMKYELHRHALYFPLAKNKPYLGTENYAALPQKIYFRAVMWREIALGKQTLLFWEMAGMKKPGERCPSFSLLCPEVIQPTEFEVWKTMPEELKKTGTFFLDRRNKCYAPQIGFLHSNATLRRAALSRTREGLDSALDMIAALHFSYYDCAGVFEENLKEKLGGFKVILLGNVTNTTEEADSLLRDFVKKGGTLFISGALPLNEYDKPLPQPLWDVRFEKVPKTMGTIPEFGITARTERRLVCGSEWKVTGTLKGIPVMAEKPFGKGKLIVLAANMQDYALAEILKPVMRDNGIEPYGKILKGGKDEALPNIELFCFREPKANGKTGWMIFNHNQETKLFRLAVPDTFKTVWDPVKAERYPVRNGFITLMLSPLDCAVLIANDPKESGELVTAEQLAAKQQKKLQEEHSRKLARKSTVVDIEKQANIGFDNSMNWRIDSVFIEKDHKYLRGVPFHKQIFGDIVFDVLRFDYHSNRTCITLKSAKNPNFPSQVTIPMDRKCGDLMFLASTVGGKAGDTAFQVKINYIDSSSIMGTVKKGADIGDWKIDRNPAGLRRQAVWRDPEGYGLFLVEVHNPKPSKTVSSITLVSAENEVSPVICGISALDTIFTKEYKNSVPLSEVFPEMQQPKQKDEHNSWKDNLYRCSKNYSELRTGTGKPSPYLDSPEKIDRCVIRGSIRMMRDEFGKLDRLSWFCMTLPGSDTRYMTYYSYLVSFFRNKSSEHWIEFELPLGKFRGKLQSMSRISIHPGRPYGIEKQIRDLRLEWDD